jgi:hypothetical protein
LNQPLLRGRSNTCRRLNLPLCFGKRLIKRRSANIRHSREGGNPDLALRGNVISPSMELGFRSSARNDVGVGSSRYANLGRGATPDLSRAKDHRRFAQSGFVENVVGNLNPIADWIVGDGPVHIRVCGDK